MFSFGGKLKSALGAVSNPGLAAGRAPWRDLAGRPGDEDIKWQWAVRESPCARCGPHERPGWVARVLGRRKVEELTNRRREVVRRPKIWEVEYYSYLLPDCEKKGKKKKTMRLSAPATDPACPAKDRWCEGKRTVVHLKDASSDDLKPCTEPLNFEPNRPFCLNEVCGKAKPAEPESKADPAESFKCLNDYVEAKERGGGDQVCKDSK